jgi:DNA-binding NarL/FixJ family response regulator
VVAVIGDLWQPDFEARVRLAALVGHYLIDAAGSASGRERTEILATADRLHADAARVLDAIAAQDRHFGIEGDAWWQRVEAQHLHLRWLCGAGGDPDELLAVWRRALDGFVEFGQVFEVARARLRIAEVLRAAGRSDEAAAELDEAEAIATRLRAARVLEAVKGLRGGSSEAPGPASLTPRESEILVLVAEGRTNGQIAGQLFISTKTVSVHVSNILAKLGASRRTEAAAIARRDGLI